MARKQTPNMTTSKKVAAGKHAVRKAGVRVPSPAKNPVRKAQPAKKDHRHAIKAAAAKAAPLAKKMAIKKPVPQAKPAAVKGPAKPVAQAQRPVASKPVPPQQAGAARPATNRRHRAIGR
jgi:hypothetical protein